MKVQYYIENNLIKEVESDLVPRLGDMVWIDDVMYIEDIVWYPLLGSVRIYLSEERPTTRKKIAESKDSRVESSQLNAVLASIKSLTEEVKSVKNQLSNTRQHIKQIGNKIK